MLCVRRRLQQNLEVTHQGCSALLDQQRLPQLCPQPRPAKRQRQAGCEQQRAAQTDGPQVIPGNNFAALFLRVRAQAQQHLLQVCFGQTLRRACVRMREQQRVGAILSEVALRRVEAFVQARGDARRCLATPQKRQADGIQGHRQTAQQARGSAPAHHGGCLRRCAALGQQQCPRQAQEDCAGPCVRAGARHRCRVSLLQLRQQLPYLRRCGAAGLAPRHVFAKAKHATDMPGSGLLRQRRAPAACTRVVDSVPSQQLYRNFAHCRQEPPVTRVFRRVLIANRGEIAVRIARSLREVGIEAVAVYAEPDRDALHVRMADLAVPIGAAAATDSYLNIEAVLQAARDTGADAIHPGYGFLSERPAFADACAAAGITLIGPSPKAMRVMGDKTTARNAMHKAGVPIVPGSDSALSAEDATRWADKVGYPVLLKASAGGGGKGMRMVEQPEALVGALRAAQSEAINAFGDGAVYLEKAILRPRHIEIQIFADAHGNVVSLGERECSMQRRHQKVIEEAPSAIVDDQLRARMGEVACQAARAVQYVGAGTVEFLLDESGAFYFLEMNTRLQVEHAVTEQIYGVDLVAAQVRAAQGLPLSWRQEDLRPRGHSIEARVYAEDSDRDFMPSPGKVGAIAWPQGPGIRVDAGIAAGVEITPYYDPMVAKVVAWGETREIARRRLVEALQQTHVQGVTTNISFLLSLLAAPPFVQGQYHTGTLAELLALPAAPVPDDVGKAALVALVLARFRADQSRQERTRELSVPQQIGWRLTPWRVRGS